MRTLYCYKCSLNLPVKSFRVDRNRSYGSHKGFSNLCRLCSSKMAKLRRSVIKELLASARKRARLKHLKYNINEDFILYLKQKQNNKCAISGIPLNWNLHKRTKGLVCPFDRVSIDRINPQEGYIKNNIQLVTDIANRAKGAHPIKIMVAFCKDVAKLNP